jgi:hypothetical protein
LLCTQKDTCARTSTDKKSLSLFSLFLLFACVDVGGSRVLKTALFSDILTCECEFGKEGEYFCTTSMLWQFPLSAVLNLAASAESAHEPQCTAKKDSSSAGSLKKEFAK